MTRQRIAPLLACAAGAASLYALTAGLAVAQTSTPPATAPTPQAAAPQAAAPAASAASGPAVAIELNKLEVTEKGCRVYIVVNNPSDATYQSYKLDLVLFQTDGVIGRRMAIDLAPLRPLKKTVKLFDVEGIACDKIDWFLINDVMDCKSGDGAADSCLARLTASSLSTVKLSK